MNAKNLILPNFNYNDAHKYMYMSMFSGCTKLETSPYIQLTNFDGYAHLFCNMFKGCSKLSSIEVDFTDWGTIQSSPWGDYIETTDGWVNGVAANGQFICPAALPQYFGLSFIPSGWTVITK